MNVSVTDLRGFELPIPGVWRKILASEATPGLTSKDRDNSFPVRTRVARVGAGQRSAAYLKDELMKRGLTTNEELDIFLVAVSDTVNGFRNSMGGRQLRMRLDPEPTLTDLFSGTVWDIRGKYVRGKMAIDLEPVVLSDEYWFAWKRFHPTSELIRL